MNKQELLSKINELEKQIEDLKNQVNSTEFEGIKKGEREMLKYGECYYIIGDNGSIYSIEWLNSAADLFRFKTGNCFKTEQEAEEYKENLLTKQALKDLALELNNGVEIDWEGYKQEKYYIYYLNYKEKCLNQYYSYTVQQACINCLDENFLTIAKDRIGEEKLIKLIKSGV